MNETLGWNFILMGNLMKSFLNEEQQSFIDSVKGENWYSVSKLIELLDSVEQNSGSDKVKSCGKGIYYTVKDKVEQMGVKTPLDALKSIVSVYFQNNRGDSIGEWELQLAEDGHVILKDNTIYNCSLGEGVILGAVKAFGGKNVKIMHTKCKKKGDKHCINEISWT